MQQQAYPNPKYRGYIVNDPLNKDLKFDPRRLVDFNQNGGDPVGRNLFGIELLAPTGFVLLNTDKFGQTIQK